MESKTKSLLLIASAVTTTMVMPASSYAATLSFSQLNFNLEDFNLTPLENNNSNFGDNVAISGDETSTVTAEFDGGLDLIFDGTSNLITGSPQSQAMGEGNNYFGLSPLSSQAVGDFSIAANESFRFDFQASLNVENTVTLPDTGSVQTLAGASFFLVDTDTEEILDFFRVVGEVKTNLLGGENLDNEDVLFREGSPNVSFSQAVLDDSFGGLEESAQATVTGSFNRVFETDTDFTLFVNSVNRSCVQAPITSTPCEQKIPEPSTVGALACFFVGLGVIRFPRRIR